MLLQKTFSAHLVVKQSSRQVTSTELRGKVERLGQIDKVPKGHSFGGAFLHTRHPFFARPSLHRCDGSKIHPSKPKKNYATPFCFRSADLVNRSHNISCTPPRSTPSFSSSSSSSSDIQTSSQDQDKPGYRSRLLPYIPLRSIPRGKLESTLSKQSKRLPSNHEVHHRDGRSRQRPRQGRDH